MLIIKNSKETEDVKARVYRETLEHIIKKRPDAVIYDYVDDPELLSLIQSKNFSVVITTNEISHKTSVMLKGMDLIQIVIGLKEELSDTSDIILDPLLRKSNQFLVGTKYLLPTIMKKYDPKVIAQIMSIDENVLLKDVDHNQAEAELVDVIDLYQKLAWDSDFFGINIGYVSCLRLTPNIEKRVKGFIRKEKIDMLEYLCNCHDKKSVMTAEKNGYSFVDIRLTFEKQLRKTERINIPEGYLIRKATKDDIGRLKKIAGNIYKLSRYYYDANFDQVKVSEFYANWIEKAVLGTFDHYTYVLCHGEAPVGFCSVREQRKNAASIGLFGMSADYSGKGLAQILLDATLQKLKENGIDYVEVVTQGRNYGAQRLYQRAGFVTKSTELWYHKWFC
jgi:dTDP-4-amino-4,6-dideoxy-D-galactose acyltransferase